MKTPDKIENPLIKEVRELPQRIAELEALKDEHKQTKEALRESEDRLKIDFESIQTGIAIIDSETHRIVDINPIASRLIGAPKGQIIGSICHKYICPAEEGKCPITDLGKTVDNSERVLLTAGGERCSVMKTVVPLVLGGRKHLLESFVDITERKRVEAQLKASERKFRDLTEATPDWIWEVDKDGRYTYVSPKVKDLLGYEASDVLGKIPFDFMTEEEAGRVGVIFKEKVIKKETIFGLENVNRHKNGHLVILETSGAPILDEKGNLTGYRGIDRDITERKQMEEALRKQKVEAQRLAEENAALAEIGRIISNLNIEEENELFFEKVKDLLPYDRIVINIIDPEKGLVKNVYMSGEAVPGRTAGEIYPLQGSGNAEVVRMKSTFLLQTEDFNEYKGRFPALMSTFQAGFQSIMDVPLFSNGKVIGGLLFRSRKPYAYTDKDLRIAERIGNQIAGTIANVQLFAELKRAEESLRNSQEVLEARVRERTEDLVCAKDAAEAASRAKSEFLANMSHELRTPLNHIIGFTELVVDKKCGELNQVQEEYLNDVLQSSRHLLSLINDVLDLSKVEAGKLQLEVTEMHLRMLLESSLSMVKEKALKHQIQLLTEMDGIPEVIQADERKLKQILYNLLSNAMKFTPDGGSVTLSARYLSFRDGQWFTPDGQPVGLPLDRDDLVLKGKGLIDISVQDTGIGIKGEDLQRIFDSFEQVENSASRKYQGSGLGLSLTRRLVELHGGRIWAESEGEGKGSKFILLMPA